MQGGNWHNGVHCGPRTVNLNNTPLNRNTNTGVRLACDNSLFATNKEGTLITVFVSVAFLKRIVRLIIRPFEGKYASNASKDALFFTRRDL